MSYAVEKAKPGRRPFTVVEVDLDFCTRSYGVAPCTAALGVTGAQKCFNTRATCQDPDNYLAGVRTYRFCENAVDRPRELEALSLLEGVQFTPAKLSVGSGLGERAKVTITLRDGLHNDAGNDPYVTERSYNPLEQGTFFGRWLARNRYFLGRPVRVLTGYLTENAAGGTEFDSANFQTRTFFLEKAEGPDAQGRVTLTAKDLLKLADDERAVAPRPAQGRLLAGINAAAGAATLTPTGIGDAAYSTSGKLRINGEIMSFTRAGDALTLTARAQHFTAAADHSADDAVQECLEFVGKRIHEIAYTLLTTYAGADAAYIPLADWQVESDAYNTRLYNALIAEPTGVNQLMTELAEQGPAYWWWDDLAAKLIYRSLRPAISASVDLGDDANFLSGSVQVKTRLDLRISEVLCYFGQRDPTEPLDRASNYRVSAFKIGTGGTADKHGQPRTKIIYSRFLSATARTFVDDICSSYLQRFDEPPREMGFVLAPKDGALAAGDLFRGTTRRMQGPDGAPETATFQVQQAGPDGASDRIRYAALEERYVPREDSIRYVTIDANTLDYNLRADHDTLYAAPTQPVTVQCTVAAGAVVGSSAAATPAFDVGDWPAGSTITIVVRGRIQGAGGDGGAGGRVFNSGYEGPDRHYAPFDGLPGEAGGTALRTRFPVTLIYTDGEIWGGGGGGGGGGGLEQISSITVRVSGGGGGGGAGTTPGSGGPNGTATGLNSTEASPGGTGTDEAYGERGNSPDLNDGGRGGLPGEAAVAGGTNTGYQSYGNPGAAGAAGNAMDGVSYVTVSGAAGDLKGPTIN